MCYSQGTLDSVNQLASQTYSAFNKEGTGSRESLTSLASQLSLNTLTAGDDNNGVSEVGVGSTMTTSSSSSGQFFSLGDDDDPVSLSNANSPTKTPTPALNNSGNNENWFKRKQITKSHCSIFCPNVCYY